MKNLFPAHVLFGSNIDPEANLRRALARLDEMAEIEAGSGVYRSAPVGTDQGEAFLNAAIRVRTTLAPAALKYDILRPIEEALGRRRSADRNAPRTVDLDLVLFGDLILDQRRPRVLLPDPDLLVHAHAARPIADLDPAMGHPVSGETFRQLAERLDAESSLERIAADALRF